MSKLKKAFNKAATGGDAEESLRRLMALMPDGPVDSHLDNQADGFKADPPPESASDDQADGYKGPPEDDAISVMRQLKLKTAKKEIVL